VDWVKLSVRYYADHAIESLPDADTELMFVRGLARAGEVKQGGFIPETSLPHLSRKRRFLPLVDALVTAGLWTRVDGGYRVNGWDHWQDGIEALAKRRADDRERQRKRRSRELSRDVTRAEGELEGESEGRARASAPPSPRCAKHENNPTSDPCRGCKNARLLREEYDGQQFRAEQERLAAVIHCKLCNSDGMRLVPGRGLQMEPPVKCNHQALWEAS